MDNTIENMINSIDLSAPVPEYEPMRQYYYLKACRQIVKAKEERYLSEKYNKMLNTKCTGVDQMTVNLSGGNQQKVIISKWLAIDSNVFIFDEPTSALDLKTERVIAKTIENIKNKIVIIVSHSNVFDRIVDTIYEEKKNEIIIKRGK